MFLLTDALYFPPVEQAEEGIVAMGGDLSPERLLLAYRSGIFPWFSRHEPILWWCPDPRFILSPAELKISKSMQAIIKKKPYSFTINKAFGSVIENCKTISRGDYEGSWISDEMIAAYTRLHQMGYAISAEAWENNELVGGLYGVKIGKVFFGESMFSKKTNASKFAFIHFVRYLMDQHVQLIDCQVYTPHLESLGAKMISRKEFCNLLEELIPFSL